MTHPHPEHAQDKETFWQHHLDSCNHSSLSGAAYCQEHALAYHRFIYWRRKLTAEISLPAVPPTGFSQVVLQSPPYVSGLRLHLSNGLEIHGIDAANVSVVHQLLVGL